MSSIIGVTAHDDFTVLIEFEQGNKVLFNMSQLVDTLPYIRLSDPLFFKTVEYEAKSIYWEEPNASGCLFPLRFSVDEILFSIRG